MERMRKEAKIQISMRHHHKERPAAFTASFTLPPTCFERRLNMKSLSFLLATGVLLSSLCPLTIQAQPVDGTYEGTTSQGRPISIEITGGAVTSWSLSFQCGATTGSIQVNTNCPIIGNAFNCGSAICAPYTTGTNIVGTHVAESLTGNLTLRTTPGLSGCCTLNASWSATLPPPEVCQEARTLSCGETDTRANDSTGSTDAVMTYSCSPFSYSAREYSYRFQPTVSQQAIISLSALSDDLDLFVLRDLGSGCDPITCLKASTNLGSADERVSLDAMAGEVYYVVVDGVSENVSSYSVALSCPLFADGFESGDVTGWDTYSAAAAQN